MSWNLDVDDEDQPSGITIYSDKDIAEQEDGEIMEADYSKPKPKRKKSVEFPGINAPIPENADERLWSARGGPSSSSADTSRSWSQHRSSSNYGSRGYHREQRLGDLRDDGPPGDPGYTSPRFSFHPRFGGSHDSAPSPLDSTGDRSSRGYLHEEEPPKPFSFHSLHYSSTSERFLSPLDQDSGGRLGNWSSESLYDRYRDRWSEDRHRRSWR